VKHPPYHPLKGTRVVLDPISHADIETIRCWRNSPEVNRFFIWRGHISREQQEQWYRRVAKSGSDFFFVIRVAGRAVGLMEIKNIDWIKKQGEGGIFIAEESDRNSMVGIESLILISDFSFYELGLKKKTVRVLAENSRALRYNKSLGYREIGRQEIDTTDGPASVVLLELTEADYAGHAARIRRIIDVPPPDAANRA